jgi:hypothetical protein
VKERKQPPIDLEVSHRATTCCVLGNISYLTGRKIRWDAERETIPDDAEAAGRLERPRRKGFQLPEA